MSSDFIDSLMGRTTYSSINTHPRIMNNAVQQEAIDIMTKLKNGKIRLRRATNSAELQIVEAMMSLADRHERYKKYTPLPEYIARPIVSVYKQAIMLGMIDDGKDLENETLKQKNKDLEKEIVRLREQLGIQEEIDIPSVDFVSDLEEKND